MILAQNHQQLLNGSKRIAFFLLLVITFTSCSRLKGRKTRPTPPPPVVEEPVVDNPTTEPSRGSDVKPIDGITKPNEPVVVEPIDTIKKVTPVLIKEQVNLAVILPFQLDKADATGKITSAGKNSLNLYKGIQFALNEMDFDDKEVNVYVFDNNGATDKTLGILQQDPFPKVDAVIGPLYSKNIKVVADYAKQNKIPFISPLSSSEKLVEGNPYIISANATKSTRYEMLLNYIDKEFVQPNVGLIYQPFKKEIAVKDAFVRIAKQQKVELLEKKSEGRSMFSVSEEMLQKGKDNVLILPTDDNEEGVLYLDRMLTYLDSLGDQYAINVVGLSEWNAISAISPSKYPQVNFYILDRYFVDESDYKVGGKVSELKAANNGKNMHVYTLQGYDMMSFVGNLIAKYGNKFEQNLTEETYNGLQTKYHFSDFKSIDGKKQFVENKYINILQFKNGNWEKVN